MSLRVESAALVRNDALTSDTPTNLRQLDFWQGVGAEYPFIIQMGDKGDPYHFYAFQTSFGAPFSRPALRGEYTAELVANGSGGTEFAKLAEIMHAGIVSPSITGRHCQAEVPDGAASTR